MCAFDWYQNNRPWMTLNCCKFKFSRNLYQIDGLIGTRIHVFDWYEKITLDNLQRPILYCTLLQKICVFGAAAKVLLKIVQYYQRQKCGLMTSFGKYKVYADTRGNSSGRGRQMRVGLSKTAIFGDLVVPYSARAVTLCCFGHFNRSSLLTSSKTLQIKPTMLYYDMLSLVRL